MKRFTSALIYALLLAVVPAENVVATSGTLVVASDSTLSEDHFGDILIDADEITLDCAGHDVTGSGQLGGIFVRGRADVTVRNCTVKGFNRGFLVDRSENINLTGNTATQNQWGFWISFSHDNRVEGNIAEGNRQSGFYLGSSSTTELSKNHSTTNGLSGFSLHDSDSNTLLQNTSVLNEVAGFFIDFSHSNWLEGNISRTNETGFELLNSSGNTLIGNEAISNAKPGFRFAEVDLVYVADNTAANNGEDSYRVEGLTSIIKAHSLEADTNSLLDQGGLGSADPAEFSNDGSTSDGILPSVRPEFIGLLLIPAAVLALLIINRTGRVEAILHRLQSANGTASLKVAGGLSDKIRTPINGEVPGEGSETPAHTSPSISDVEDALRHIHNLAYLGTHRLSSMRLVRRRVPPEDPTTHVDLGRITQDIIREAIDKFRPADKRPARGSPPEWHQYLILYEAYFEGRLNREVMADLHIGEGTFNRRRREGIRALARLLAEWDEAEANGPTDPKAF